MVAGRAAGVGAFFVDRDHFAGRRVDVSRITGNILSVIYPGLLRRVTRAFCWTLILDRLFMVVFHTFFGFMLFYRLVEKWWKVTYLQKTKTLIKVLKKQLKLVLYYCIHIFR